MRRSSTVAIILAALVVASCAAFAGQEPPAEHHPRQEDTYTITSVLQILNPVEPADMNDEFQDVRVLARDKDSATVEITYFPLYQPDVGEDANWRRDDVGMTEYLRPTPSEDWDETMRKDLITELRQANI